MDPVGSRQRAGLRSEPVLAGLKGSQRHQEGDYQVVETTKGFPEVGRDVAGRSGGPRPGPPPAMGFRVGPQHHSGPSGP